LDGPEREDLGNATARGGTPPGSLGTKPRAREVKSLGPPARLVPSSVAQRLPPCEQPCWFHRLPVGEQGRRPPNQQPQRCEHRSAYSQNQATISRTTPAWGTSTGKWLIMDWAAKDTTARSAENCEATSVCRAIAKSIPTCRGSRSGELVTVMHNSEPLIIRKVSS
jgi:hypothetical protein